jgi:signal transduction histidine kinase
MKVFFARTPASMPSRPDNTLEVVAIPCAGVNQLEGIVNARIAYPRAAIVTVGPEELAADSARAGAHAHVALEADVEAAAPLARARKDAEDALIARHQDASNLVGHELRNPLNVIAMTLAFLQEAPDLAPERRAAHLEKVERAVERITTLLDDLAEATRFDAGQVSLHLEPVLVSELVTAAFARARYAAEQRAMTLASSGGEGLVVHVDRVRVTRAVGAVVDAVIAAARSGSHVQLDAKDGERAVAFVASASPAAGGARPLGRGVSVATAWRVIRAHGGDTWSDSSDARELNFSLPKPPRS